MSDPITDPSAPMPVRRERSHRLAPRLERVARGLVPASLRSPVRRLVARALSRDLTRLGRLYGTDKYWRHGYTTLYQRHLPERNDVRTLFEIGVGGYKQTTGGDSLRMWRSFYPKAQVYGLDIHPKTIDESRITVYQGDQTDAAQLHEIIDQIGQPDVIIDDGSHQQDHIRATFAILFEQVRPGGWYVIEDLHTAYMPRFGGGDPGMPDTAVTLVEGLVGEANQGTTVAELHVYPKIAFIRRPG